MIVDANGDDPLGTFYKLLCDTKVTNASLSLVHGPSQGNNNFKLLSQVLINFVEQLLKKFATIQKPRS